MKFKDRFNKILKQLKLIAKAKEGKLTQEEWDQIESAYKEKYDSDFSADQEAYEKATKRASVHSAALELLNGEEEAQESNTEDPDAELSDEEKEARKTETPAMKALRTEKEAALKATEKEKKKNKLLSSKVEALEQEAEDDNPKTIVMNHGLISGKTTEKYLFGIEHPLFAMDKRWNKISNNQNFATLEEPDEAVDGANFRQAVAEYAASFAANFKKWQQSGENTTMVAKFEQFFKTGSVEKLSVGLDVDYSELTNAGLGEQFIVLRQQALAARILMVPTVFNIFPRRYGIQDRDLITNAFFGEYSQAQQLGEVWKGEMELQPEVGHVDDAMYKTLFNSMKWIERQYIGYLNNEGSDPIKWSMIEWMVLNISTVLTQEQSKRKILGQYVAPTVGTAGNMLFASTGVIYTLIRYQHENKLLALDDAAYQTYSNTGTVFVDAVDAFLTDVMEKRDNLDMMEIYLNANHSMWYKQSVRRKYGKDFDFTGPDGDMVPDWNVKINWVPNMEQYKYMWVSKAGNVQSLENVPGEMYKIGFQPDMETVKSWSNWKEGTAAGFVGKQFDTLLLLIANDYNLQELFINKPVTDLVDDATTCDGTLNFWFRSIANTTPAQNITDITGAVDGKAYIIETGHATNPQTVTKAAKFDQISATFTPVAVGDYLMVYYRTSDSKFIEMERVVNGVRTVVAAVQPNIPGAR